jgi:hypothetical protein
VVIAEEDARFHDIIYLFALFYSKQFRSRHN